MLTWLLGVASLFFLWAVAATFGWLLSDGASAKMRDANRQLRDQLCRERQTVTTVRNRLVIAVNENDQLRTALGKAHEGRVVHVDAADEWEAWKRLTNQERGI